MYEKILQKLKENRGTTSMVSDRTLEDMAKSLIPVIKDEEVLKSMDFTSIVKSIEGNISHYTAEQIKRVQKEQEDANNQKKKEDEGKQKRKQSDEIPEYIQLIMEQNQKLLEAQTALSNEMNSLKSEKVANSRQAKLKSALNGIPDFVVNPILSAFEKTSFTDESEFEGYLTSTSENAKLFLQSAKEQGLNITIPSKDVKKPVDTGETGLLLDARTILQKAKEKQDK